MRTRRSLLAVGCVLGLLCCLAGAQKSYDPTRAKESGGKTVTQRSASTKAAAASASADKQRAKAAAAASPEKSRIARKNQGARRPAKTSAAKAPGAGSAARPAEMDAPSAMQAPRPNTPSGLPPHYASILDGNLFRRLGWSGEPKRDPFQLVGVMVSDNTRRALLSHNGSAVYVDVGAEVGEGYTVASIERGAVELQGGALGPLNLALDRDVIGIKGAGSHNAAAAKAPEKRVKKDGR